MEGADGETDFEIASKRCCNKHAQALGRGRPNLVRNTISSEGSHFSGDVTCCESYVQSWLKKKKQKKHPFPSYRAMRVSDRWLAGTGGKDVGAQASLLPVQAAHLFPSAQHWNLFLWQSCCGLRLCSPPSLLSPLYPELMVTHLRGQSRQSWQPVEATHRWPRVAPTSTHHKTSSTCPRFKCFPHSTLPF